MSERRLIPPDWHLIKIEEKQHWREDIQAQAEHIYGVYAFDKNSHTHCCELTPSYDLNQIGYEVVAKDTLTDAQRESLEEDVMQNFWDEYNTYMHVSTVDRMMVAHPERVRKVNHLIEFDTEEDDTPISEQLMEAWNTGAAMW